jgi:hypothetical protein
MTIPKHSLSSASKRRIERSVNSFCQDLAGDIVTLFETNAKVGFPEIQAYVSTVLLEFLTTEIIPRLKAIAPNLVTDEELDQAIDELLNLRKEDAN